MSQHRTAFRTALAGLLLPLASLAHGQESGGDDETTLEDLKKVAEEMSRDFDARQLEFEKIGAYLGRSGPWPRLDPELAGPVWGESVLAAERITAGDVLERSGTVDLDVAHNQRLGELFEDAEDLIGAGVEAVVAAGRRTDSESEVKLKMVLVLGSASYRFSTGGRSTGEEALHFLQITASLVLPARVLRGGAVHHVPLTVATTIKVGMWPAQPGRAEVESEMTAAARKLLERAASQSTTASAGPGVWGPWIGDPAQASQRYGAWNESFRSSSRELEPALDAVPGFREILPWDESYRSDWTRALAASGFSAGLVDAPDLRGELFFDAYGGGGRLNGGGLLIARTSVVERDAVAVLGGGYVRLAGDSFVDVTLPGITTAGELGQRTGEVQAKGIGEFFAELGHGGGRPGQVRHRDADLVATYLATRQRVPLSQEFIDGVANRIAVALDGAPDIPESWKNSWKESPGGEPMYYLPHVGSARRAELVPRDVQQAVRRVIDDLSLADPLGLYAFDQPWNYDRSRRQNELPEGFAEVVQGERPSGPGALERVYVDSADSAAWDLASSYGQKDRYRSVQSSLASTFGDHRILACAYIPSDGDIGLTTHRYFWYDEEPAGWEELVKTLPAEIRMDRIGPPLRQAPSYVTEADELIDQRATR